ncbi:MAG: 30S ribosomal protein S3 [Candidatus Colwellbacteria bacterium]|nr:30S ribosomal protein S3 [Candidatus Colwellbacteria bacterium]
MARKINPNLYRLGINKNWDSRWFAPKRGIGKWLKEDVRIRKVIASKTAGAGIASVEIERAGDKLKILIKASKPGLIIGRGGKGVEMLIRSIEQVLDQKVAVSLNVEEVKRTEVHAAVVAQNIASDLIRRMKYRRTIKKHLEYIMQNREVKGAKIMLSGRLDGNEIARTEWLAKGKLPLSTLRSNIDYGTSPAVCSYGTVGVKVWLYKGEIFTK